MDSVAAYFAAERTESLIFITIGALALGAGLLILLWRRTPFLGGMAGPLIAIALIQLVVGITVFVRSPHDTVRVQQALQTDRAHVVTVEIPRMITVSHNFVLYRWVELALLAVGITLLVAVRRHALMRGVGLGLALQAGLMLALDAFAEQRALSYLEWLKGP